MTGHVSEPDTCHDCGRQIEREDTPIPGASWAPVPWWHHASEAEARACPGRGPVQPREQVPA